MSRFGQVVSDDAVPEGHKGLHGFLYAEGDAAHAASTMYDIRKGEDDGSALLPVSEYLDARDGERPLGVYALYDTQQRVQYIGYARNMVLAIRSHLARVGPERCAWVRAMVFANKAMSTRANLERETLNWVEELCGPAGPPVGNTTERALWDGRTADASSPAASVDLSAMSAAEVAAYEEKKLRMRKAMGDNIGDDAEGETLDARERRLRLLKAVEGDDWSSVIDGQNRATYDPSAAAAASTSGADGKAAGGGSKTTIISPFTRSEVTASVDEVQSLAGGSGSEGSGNGSGTGGSDGSGGRREPEKFKPEMNVKTVDVALEAVRPYLVADGGDVEVADVAAGVVFVRLQGACGTCASSAATLKMGIERSLKNVFGDQLKEVVQVDGQSRAASVTSVDAHLNVIRPALQNFGGSVDVVTVEQGTAVLRYKGPKPLGVGVSAAVRDQFPDIKEVVLVD